MNQQAMTSGYAFSGNPVIFREGEIAGITGGIFKVFLKNSMVYKGKFSLPFSVNLAEIAEAEISPVRLPYFAPEEWLHKETDLSSNYGPNILTMLMEYDNDGEVESFPIRMIRGRIPSAQYVSLTGSGKDIFTERFLNPEANFFFTTRTSGTLIEIPESELYPLCLLLPGDVSLKVEAGGVSFVSEVMPQGRYWLNLDRIRKRVFMESIRKNLVSEFFISYGNCESGVRVVFTRSEPTLNRIRIRYRNSFEVPELFSFDGSLSIKIKDEREDAEYLKYSGIADDFIKMKEAGRNRLKLSLDTGPVDPKDIGRMLELIASKDVALESPVDGSYISVIPSAEDIEFPLHPEEPQSFTISLETCFEDLSLIDYFSPNQASVMRIFSMEHNDKFN